MKKSEFSETRFCKDFIIQILKYQKSESCFFNYLKYSVIGDVCIKKSIFKK